MTRYRRRKTLLPVAWFRGWKRIRDLKRQGKEPYKPVHMRPWSPLSYQVIAMHMIDAHRRIGK